MKLTFYPGTFLIYMENQRIEFYDKKQKPGQKLNVNPSQVEVYS